MFECKRTTRCDFELFWSAHLIQEGVYLLFSVVCVFYLGTNFVCKVANQQCQSTGGIPAHTQNQKVLCASHAMRTIWIAWSLRHLKSQAIWQADDHMNNTALRFGLASMSATLH